MNKDTFWTMIDDAVKAHPQNDDASLEKRAEWLEAALACLDAAEIFMFEKIWEEYEKIAATKPLEKIATKLCGGMSDDGFTDYKAWFVIQGRANVEAMIADPDKMKEIAHKGKHWTTVTAETAGYVIMQALERKNLNRSDNPLDNGSYDLTLDRHVTFEERDRQEYGEHFEWVNKLTNLLNERARNKRLRLKVESKQKLIATFLNEFAKHVKS